MQVSNPKITEYKFLDEMYQDSYFPNSIVDKGKIILLELCSKIEEKKPESSESVYKLTHAATEKFNELNNEFGENGSEIETAARENIGKDFAHILESYGYNLDIEEAMAPREW
ncbi:MAG: hypothetical protein HRU20_15990 [Pseudomonadales bacterium]|nr:hypothetical protein [Pseudomonadales bacterium]